MVWIVSISIAIGGFGAMLRFLAQDARFPWLAAVIPMVPAVYLWYINWIAVPTGNELDGALFCFICPVALGAFLCGSVLRIRHFINLHKK